MPMSPNQRKRRRIRLVRVLQGGISLLVVLIVVGGVGWFNREVFHQVAAFLPGRSLPSSPPATVARAPELVSLLPTLPQTTIPSGRGDMSSPARSPSPLPQPTLFPFPTPTPTLTPVPGREQRQVSVAASPVAELLPTVGTTQTVATLPSFNPLMGNEEGHSATEPLENTPVVVPSFAPLPQRDTPIIHHAPIPTPRVLGTSYGRLLPSHGGWYERQDVPKFMTLPFSPDAQMKLLQGWFYDSGGLQSGIDYFRQETDGTFTGFPVLAAADGYACGEWDPTAANSPTGGGCVAGFGHRVLIRHEVGDETYYTYYGHLETIANDIPLGSRNDTVQVERGQFLGYAGNTGTGGSAIHLHFGIFSVALGWLDPYDLRSTHEVYPDPNLRNGLRSGFNDFWTSNPPTYPGEYNFSSDSLLRPGLETFWTPDFPTAKRGDVQQWEPEGAVLSPRHNTLITGTVLVSGWVAEQGEEEIAAIEIWMDGELLHRPPYGLPVEGAEGGGFRWEWDTMEATNGVHTLQVRAIRADGTQALLSPLGERGKTRLVVNVQNIQGKIAQPAPAALLKGRATISGWAKAGGGSIEAVEVWIDGSLSGVAEYGLPMYAQGGDYGFRWEWDTVYASNGPHTVQVRVRASSGAEGMLVHRESPMDELVVQVENVRVLPLGKWNIR